MGKRNLFFSLVFDYLYYFLFSEDLNVRSQGSSDAIEGIERQYAFAMQSLHENNQVNHTLLHLVYVSLLDISI